MHLRRFILVLILIPAIPLGLMGLFLLFVSLTDYKPPQISTIAIKGKGLKMICDKTEMTFFSWNIGYAGLGSKMDFFYEGGARVRPQREEFQRYFEGIRELIRRNDTADFVFVQEVDSCAKRSYRLNEVNEIAKELHGFSYVFAKNYNCRFVPVPISSPMGDVVSGIVSCSKSRPTSAERISYDSKFSWPKQLFLLKRCFVVMRFLLTGGKELVVVNTHNSTYDKDGRLRSDELKKLKLFLTNEYAKGNFVVAGGDWNNNPPGFSPESIHTGDHVKIIEPPINHDFLSGWKFAFDPENPTNRDVDHPYIKGVTKTTIIDFFVLSPNIELVSIKTLPVSFTNSDHQPVILKVHLK